MEATRIRASFSVFATVSATLAGFFVTALSILFAIQDKPFIKKLRESGHFHVLLLYIYWALSCYVATLIASLVAIFIPDGHVKIAIALIAGLQATGLAFSLLAAKPLLRVIEFSAD